MTGSAPGVTVVYTTYRPVPHFDWFADSLARQAGDADVEVVLVDGLHAPERTAAFGEMVRGRFAFRHVPPMPSPYAGPFRRTQRDLFSAASARNTGIVHASKPYVVFCDDLAVLMPDWWSEVRRAAADGYVVAGAYQKHREMVVQDGVLAASCCDPSGVDTRWQTGDDSRLVRIEGSQLFGCSFGAPRALLVEVNGFDELCDSIGGEDAHCGVRVTFSGAAIYYSRRMLTIESQEGHGAGTPRWRIDRKTLPSVYLRRLREFGVGRRCVNGAWDSSHMIIDILYGTRSNQPMGNYYLIETLNEAALTGIVSRFPTTYWFDGRMLSEL